MYRTRIEEPSEYSWWRALCEKHLRLVLMATLGFGIYYAVITGGQICTYMLIARDRAALEREKFEAEHPAPPSHCVDTVTSVGVKTERCPEGARGELSSYMGGQYLICHCAGETKK